MKQLLYHVEGMMTEQEVHSLMRALANERDRMKKHVTKHGEQSGNQMYLESLRKLVTWADSISSRCEKVQTRF